MSHKKTSRLADDQAAGANETVPETVSAYQYITNDDVCQAARYKSKNINLSEVLALADLTLAQANIFREMWLSTGDGLAWRRWRACIEDRRALLGEI